MLTMARHGEGVSFSQLASAFRANHNTLSRHLKTLTHATLVWNFYERREGKDHSFYKLSAMGKKLLSSLKPELEVTAQRSATRNAPVSDRDGRLRWVAWAFNQDASTRTGFVEVRISPGRSTLTFPRSGGLATTAAAWADRPLEPNFTNRSGTKPATILTSGADNSKCMLLSSGDIPGLTSHAIHIRCSILKIIERNLQQQKKLLEGKRVGEVDEGPHLE